MTQYQFFYRTRLGIFGSWTSILDEGRDDDMPHTWVARDGRKKKKDEGEKRMVEGEQKSKLKRSTVVGSPREQVQRVQGNFEIKLHERFTIVRAKNSTLPLTLKFPNVLKFANTFLLRCQPREK